jgi:integrase
MPRRKRGAPPPYLEHKATGQAYSTWRGETLYHGKYNTPESRRRYAELLKRWEREEGETARPDRGSVAQLAEDYRSRVASMLSADEQAAFKRNCRDLEELAGAMDPDDFGPLELKALQAQWVGADLRRQTVNKQVGRIRRIFRWGVSEGRVRPDTLGALEAVDDLKAGRSEAEDYQDVPPVPLRDLVRTLRELPPVLQALVRWQYYVGCRPGEACRTHAEELHRGEVRVKGRTVKIPAGAIAFTPGTHKNLLKGQHLVYLVGPRAQDAVEAFLGKGYLFSPQTKARRKRKPLRAPGPCYRTDSYAHAIARACAAAGVPSWSPNQLRHNWFTRMDRAAGLAAASSAGGHLSPSTTLVYIERNLRQAADLSLRHG